MTENELHSILESIDDISTSQQNEEVYNCIFSEIAHDHSGVYYTEKIDWIEKLVNIYHYTANNPKKSILISAMLNNLYYFESDSQNPQTAQQVKDLLEKFNDENWKNLENP